MRVPAHVGSTRTAAAAALVLLCALAPPAPAQAGEPRHLADTWLRHQASVQWLTYVAEGRVLVSFEGNDDTVALWDLDAEERTLVAPGLRVWGAAPTPDGVYVLVTDDDGDVRVYASADSAEVRTWDVAPSYGVQVAVSPDGETVATTWLESTPTGEVVLERDKRGTYERELETHATHLAFWRLADGEKLGEVTMDDLYHRDPPRWDHDGESVFLDAHGAVLRARAPAAPDDEIQVDAVPAMDVEGSADLVVAADASAYALVDHVAEAVRVLDGAGEERVRIAAKNPHGVSLSADGSVLAMSTTGGRRVVVVDAESGEELAGHDVEGSVYRVALSPDGESVAFVESMSAQIVLWEWREGPPPPPSDHRARVTLLAFTPDGSSLYSVGRDDLLLTWDVESGAATGSTPYPRAYDAQTWMPDLSALLESSSFDDRVVVRSLAGMSARTLRIDTQSGHRVHGELIEGVVGVAATRDGSLLAVGTGEDEDIRVVDFASGDERSRIEDPTCAAAKALAFSPDGQRLYAAGRSAGIDVFDVATGQRAATFASELILVDELVVSPNGRSLVAVSTLSRSPELWDLADERLAAQLEVEGFAGAAVWAPDGASVWVGAEDGAITRFRADGKELETLQGGHDAPITALALTSDGALLASGADDGTIALWSIETPE